MINKEAIDDALAAHVNWKKRLQDAVNTGKLNYSIHDVKSDKVCSFGQWMMNLSEQWKKYPEYEKILNLHKEFHSAAAEVLNLALNGKKEEARKKLEVGGEFGQISGRLVIELQKWRNKL